jgi:hypothetical protein
MVVSFNFSFTQMDKKYTAYYVPNFPIARVSNLAMDGWVHNPNDQKYRYNFLEGILEHISNTGVCEPVRVIINSDTDIAAGPAGVARMYAYRHILRASHMPVIVNSERLEPWFGEGVEVVRNEEDFYRYFLFKPHTVVFDDSGNVTWWNQRPDPETARRTMKIANIDRWIRSIMDLDELAKLEAEEARQQQAIKNARSTFLL